MPSQLTFVQAIWPWPQGDQPQIVPETCHAVAKNPANTAAWRYHPECALNMLE